MLSFDVILNRMYRLLAYRHIVRGRLHLLFYNAFCVFVVFVSFPLM